MRQLKYKYLLPMLMLTLTGCSFELGKDKVVNGNAYGYCPIAVHANPDDKKYFHSLVTAPAPWTMPQSTKNLIKNYANEQEGIDKYCNLPAE